MDVERFKACIERQNSLVKEFTSLSDEEKYKKLIEYGKKFPITERSFFNGIAPVPGCQSEVFLKTEIDSEGKLSFDLFSEALVSKGLAALLLLIYSGEEAAAPLLCKPFFFEEIGLQSSLSQGRSNGFSQIYKAIQVQILESLKKSSSLQQ